MARIVKDYLTRNNKERNRVHEIVEASYLTFIDDKGNKFFQIDTYGTKYRKLKNKLSQTIQFDKETAKELIEILKKEFNL
ncbi:MAG: methionyl-tRNA formyltransferase [Thermosipho sp. (in: Bacteria)]|nr:methionyl-tRNA formyltransferase [Thermosipho sp. (in: thermotogales)]